MKIYFMLSYSHAKADRPIFRDVIANLSSQGFSVTVGIGESLLLSAEMLRVEADLYLLKSNSVFWRNIAAVLEAKGARILNSYSACAIACNKIRTASYLSAAGVPVPRSWVTGDRKMIAEIAKEIPLVLKPNVGRGSNGILYLHERSNFEDFLIEDGMLLQEMITPCEAELKLYVVGERVFGIRKDPATDARAPVDVDPELAKIAVLVGRSIGLELYGVDVVLDKNGPFVVDVNYFPSYKGIPGIAEILTDHICDFVNK